MNWSHYAACQGHDPELFFPGPNGDLADRQLLAAKAVCARCPVQSICLEWAVLAGIEYGVWGGQSEEERRAPKNRKNAARSRITEVLPA